MRLGILCLFAASCLPAAESSRVLLLLPICTKSHKNVFRPLAKELADRGHEVTMFSTQRSGPIPGVRDVCPADLEDVVHRGVGNTFQFMRNPFNLFRIGDVYRYQSVMCKRILRHDVFREEVMNREFDVVVLLGAANDCMLGVVEHLGAPFVYLVPTHALPWVNAALGNPLYVVGAPTLMTPFTDRLGFTDRIVNSLASVSFLAMHKFMTLPWMESAAREVLGPSTTPFAEIHANASLVLLNSHFSTDSSRPFLPLFVEVGGMHCRPAKSLPLDLEKWIEEAGDEGFIYFSLGTTTRGVEMPEEARRIFLEAFSRLPQRVLWKWENDSMPGLDSRLSEHIRLLKWVPQQDVLGHPKLRLFATQGGMLSTQEALYHGAPLLVIPIGGDQVALAKRTASEGSGLVLSWEDLSVEKILSAVSTIIEDPSYRENTARRSILMRDQLNSPVERAAYWVEYVIRHKGAHHLRPPAADLNWFQFYLLDVVACCLLVGTFTSLISLYCLACCCRRFFCPREAGKHEHKLKSS